jgi:hypothetical protein
MKFEGEPNLFVRINISAHQRMAGRKGFSFDENGMFETENKFLIMLLDRQYKRAKVENNVTDDKPVTICKKCGATFESKGLYLAHCRKEHKKEE